MPSRKIAATAASEPFQHERLPNIDTIRVLDLLPALNRDAPIRVNLRTVSLSQGNVLGYEALSYVWGARVGDSPILCNGRTLLVTANCRTALQYLRHRFIPRILWVDAICIDQGQSTKSVQERNHQVKVMGEVYNHASRVIAWLGEGVRHTGGLFRVLRSIGRLQRLEGLQWEYSGSSLTWAICSYSSRLAEYAASGLAHFATTTCELTWCHKYSASPEPTESLIKYAKTHQK
jgi:hypothetical protein